MPLMQAYTDQSKVDGCHSHRSADHSTGGRADSPHNPTDILATGLSGASRRLCPWDILGPRAGLWVRSIESDSRSARWILRYADARLCWLPRCQSV